MIRRVASPSNPMVKGLLKQKDEYWIFEGEKLVKDIIRRGISISVLIVNEKKEGQLTLQKEKIDEVWYVKVPVLKKLSSFKEKPDYISFVEPPSQKLNLNEHQIVVVLDNIQDPANVGTIFRCAAAFGIGAIVLAGAGVKPSNPKFIRTAQDSLFTVDFEIVTDISSILSRAKDNNFFIYATSSHPLRAPISIDKVECPCLLVFGNEGKGLEQDLLDQYPTLCISQTDNVESLNVGVSACIIMHGLRKNGPWSIKRTGDWHQ